MRVTIDLEREIVIIPDNFFKKIARTTKDQSGLVQLLFRVLTVSKKLLIRQWMKLTTDY